MNWHKINITLIIVLLLINTFLAFTLHKTQKKVTALPDDLVAQAKENLETSGIVFETDVIDKTYHTKTVYKYTARTAYAEEMKQNAATTHPCLLNALSVLLSKSTQDIEKIIQYFDVPDGTSVSISDSAGGSEASAIITGKTNFEYSDSSFASPAVVTKIRENLSLQSSGNENIKTPKIIKDFFEKVYGTKISARCTNIEDVDEGILYTCILTVDGDDIYRMPICFFVKNEKIVHLNGNLFFSLPDTEYETKIIDGINILYNLKETASAKTEVISQQHEYAMIELENDGIYIFPVWKIGCRMSDGTLSFPVFNALTGKQLTYDDEI